jgi:hypothetical protein
MEMVGDVTMQGPGLQDIYARTITRISRRNTWSIDHSLYRKLYIQQCYNVLFFKHHLLVFSL